MAQSAMPICCERAGRDAATPAASTTAAVPRSRMESRHVRSAGFSTPIAQQITEAFLWGLAPSYLVRDNDGAYGHVFRRRMRAWASATGRSSRGSPWQNGCVERLTGTVCRECLDRMLIIGMSHLRRVLASYAAYYNQVRTHLALQKDAPL